MNLLAVVMVQRIIAKAAVTEPAAVAAQVHLVGPGVLVRLAAMVAQVMTVMVLEVAAVVQARTTAPTQALLHLSGVTVAMA